MDRPSQLLPVAVALAWLIFIAFDLLYWQTVRLEPTQPEMYGPVGFFQPVTKYLAMALTGALCVHSFFSRHS